MNLYQTAYDVLTLEWGADSQIKAEESFCRQIESRLTNDQIERFYDWSQKATLIEFVDYALYLVGETEIRQKLAANVSSDIVGDWKPYDFSKMQKYA